MFVPKPKMRISAIHPNGYFNRTPEVHEETPTKSWSKVIKVINLILKENWSYSAIDKAVAKGLAEYFYKAGCIYVRFK